MFTTGVTLQPDVIYQISYNYRTAYGVDDETWSIWIGTAQNSGSMTQQVSGPVTSDTTSCTSQSDTFTVSTAGTYYLGIRAQDTSATERAIVDDILLTGTQNPTFYNLQVSSTGSATFNKDVVVKNNLTIDSGATMDMGTNKITSIGATFTNNGTLCNNETFDLTPGSTQDFDDSQGVLVAQLTPAGGSTDPGDTTVTPCVGSTIPANTFGSCSAFTNSVKRYYNVTVDTSSGLNVTLRLYYTDAELNGNTEGSLEIYHCESGSWVKESGTHSRDGTNNYVQVTGVDSFSPFILSGGPPTAVTLQRFTARRAGGVNGFVLPLPLVALGAVGGALLLRAWRRR